MIIVCLMSFRFTGLYPKEGDGSMFTFALQSERLNKNDVWHAWSSPPPPGKESFRFDIWIPVFTPVGKWRMGFGYTEANGEFRQLPAEHVLIYVLFNPWSPGKFF